MFIWAADVNFYFERAASRELATEGAAMDSISRSILARSLMAGVASLAFTTMSAAPVRAETVFVQGDDGTTGADGTLSLPPGDGQDGGSVGAEASGLTGILNKATATGGNGGQGGKGFYQDNLGNQLNATAATAAVRMLRRPSLALARPTRILSVGTVVKVALTFLFRQLLEMAAQEAAQSRRAPRRI
jgi:hypothetical protein